jgi:predicted metal-dependent peptidase
LAFDLRIHVARLLEEEPFFAALSRHIEKMPSNQIPTAGVTVNPDSGRFEMLFNPDFCSMLSEKELKLLLMHEFYHLIFEHVTERLPAEGMTRTWNEATDAAINGEIFPDKPTDDIKNLFDMAILPEKFGMPRGQSAEWYFNTLKAKKEEQNQDDNQSGDKSGQGDGKSQPGDGQPGDGSPQGFDDHGGWSEDGSIPEEIKELAKQRLKEAMSEAAQEATKDGWGTVSASMRKEIIDRLTPKVDWRKVLRYFIKTSQKANKMSSIKKINRRYPYIHSGRKTSRTSKIAISIDQSGSVSDKMLAAFYAELNKLADLAEFTVVPFDTAVAEQHVYVWKKGEKRKRERVRYGGTCFNAPTKWVNERDFDGHIILTDMYAPKPVPSKCQRMWMTDKECARHPYFTTSERVIAVDY